MSKRRSTVRDELGNSALPSADGARANGNIVSAEDNAAPDSVTFTRPARELSQAFEFCFGEANKVQPYNTLLFTCIDQRHL